jgi:hypothetical protein
MKTFDNEEPGLHTNVFPVLPFRDCQVSIQQICHDGNMESMFSLTAQNICS